MKKILISVAMSMLLISGTALAANVHAVNKAKFDSHPFFSSNPDDVITIALGSSIFSNAVQITVEMKSLPLITTGINIKNCGNVTHVDRGSTVVCALNPDQPITFSADKQDANAVGYYQIEAH